MTRQNNRSAAMWGAAIAGITGCLAATPLAAQPKVTAGQILSTSVDVTKPPASPELKLHLQGVVNSITLSFQGPSGQIFQEQFNAPVSTTALLQGYSAAGFNLGQEGATFGLYVEAGTWTLASLSVCQDVSCTTYTGSPLAALFPSLTFQLINPNPSDTAPPVFNAVTIKTPTVSLSSAPNLEISIDAKDNLSGIAIVVVCAVSSGAQQICVHNDPPVHPLLTSLFRTVTPLPANTATGTYVVDNLFGSDIAGNPVTITDAATISKLMKGKTSFTVTN